MSLYAGIFYLVVGIFCGLIATGIQDWLIQRRARKLFGGTPAQWKVDEKLRLSAGEISYYQRLERNSGRETPTWLAAIAKTTEEGVPPEVKREARAKLERIRAQNRRARRLHRRAQRNFRRGQQLADHLGFTVRKSYQDYTLL